IKGNDKKVGSSKMEIKRKSSRLLNRTMVVLSQLKSKGFSDYFICNSPYHAKDYPKREKLNALRLEGNDDNLNEAQ
ncbi:Hypothetical predicted protein, partial [Olea europaea subsp. europaea]